MPAYRRVKNWPGYRVGSDGTVWSCWQRVWGKSVRSRQWRELSPVILKDGYLGVTLCLGKLRRNVRVHHLVLEAFTGPRPAGSQALHRDDNPANNKAGNLRWGTFQDNVNDRARRGGYAKGSRHHNAKLTEAIVRKIRLLKKQKFDRNAIAKQTGEPVATVTRILYSNTWSHVQV